MDDFFNVLEDGDPEKIVSLYHLVALELKASRALGGEGSEYVSYLAGRIASYQFILDAMDRRWPELKADVDPNTRSDGQER